jgi:hypothetical protein
MDLQGTKGAGHEKEGVLTVMCDGTKRGNTLEYLAVTLVNFSPVYYRSSIVGIRQTIFSRVAEGGR